MEYKKIIAALIFFILLIGLSFALADTTAAISLNKGWNFISVPYSDFVIAKSESSDTCIIKSIYHYNALSGKWDDKFTDPAKMKPGLGYWIYTDSACSITFSGVAGLAIGDIGDSGNGLLRTGWNMISGTTETINLIENKGSCIIKAVYGYDTAAEKYYKIDTIEKGKGYWVYTENNCYIGSEKQALDAAVIINEESSDTEKLIYDEALKSFDVVDKVNVKKATYDNLKNYKAVFLYKVYPELDRQTIIDIANNGVVIAFVADAYEYMLSDPYVDELNSDAIIKIYDVIE